MASAKKEIDNLRREIQRHDRLYYVEDAPEISDREYDGLMRRLKDLEALNPDLATPDSPTQRVGGEASEKFPPVTHRLPMLSLDNTYSIEELKEFHKRIVKNLGSEDDLEYVVELKFDGLSVMLTYENGVFVRGATRGDGKKGEDVTANLRTIKSIPLNLYDKSFEVLEIRGEVYMEIKAFAELNERRVEEGENPFANPRNASAGSIRLLDPRETDSRPLKIFAFNVNSSEPKLDGTHGEVLNRLRKWGFCVYDYYKICKNFEEVLREVETWEKKIHKLDFKADGLVIKVNSLQQREKLGATGKHPRWACAYKFAPEEAETIVKDIVCQVGRTGTITPVAILDPVLISGSTVSRATLHNEDEIRRLGVGVGDRVVIIKAGEIIPKVERVIGKGGGVVYQMPDNCPDCESPIVREEGEAAWRCVNASCPAQLKERLQHFASRNAMDIDHLGPAVLDQLIVSGKVKDYSDLYKLRLEDLVDFERMAEKSGKNLIDAIEKSKEVGLARLIFALGIRFVGERAATVLADTFGSLEKLTSASKEELENVDEIGPKIAASLMEFFFRPANRQEVERLTQAGVLTEGGKKSVAGGLSGKQFVLTGTLETMTRDEAKKKIMEAGGRVTSSVSAKTDFIVAGADPGSKLDKARKLGVPTLDEKGFIDLTGEE